MYLLDQLQEKAVCRRPLPGIWIQGILYFRDLAITHRIRPEISIYMPIVACIKLVQGRCIVDWIQIKCSNPQFLQVIKLIQYPLQISTVTPVLHSSIEFHFVLQGPVLLFVPIVRPRRSCPVFRLWSKPEAEYIFWCRIIIGISITESFNKNLVPHSFIRPGRRVADGSLRLCWSNQAGNEEKANASTHRFHLASLVVAGKKYLHPVYPRAQRPYEANGRG